MIRPVCFSSTTELGRKSGTLTVLSNSDLHPAWVDMHPVRGTTGWMSCWTIVIMAPLVCLIAAFVFFRALVVVSPHFSDWHFALRAAFGVMFLLTASAHWGKRREDLIRMVPKAVGSPPFWVSLTGFAEVAIAAGLQIPRVAPYVAAVAVVMLCCLFPAN